MRSSLASLILGAVLAAPAVAQPVVRDHRVPGEAAQWTVDGGAVKSVEFHRLYNTQRRKHLGGSASSLKWEDTPPNMPKVFFENCTRPGEVIYGSDLVTMRFGSAVVGSSGTPVLHPVDQGGGCEFRLIPSGLGLMPAGAGDGKFALYSTRVKRYLVFKESLRWEETLNPPHGVSARADFVPVDLFFTLGKVGDRTITTGYLTIRNIGNVASSASQNEMQIRIKGQEYKFIIPQPIPPGGEKQNPLAFEGLGADGRLGRCDQILVELDTDPNLKFQVLQGALPNDDVFANDRKTMPVRYVGGAPPAGAHDEAACPGPLRR